MVVDHRTPTQLNQSKLKCSAFSGLGSGSKFQRYAAVHRQQATSYVTEAACYQNGRSRNVELFSVADVAQAIVDPVAGIAREVPPQSR